METQTTPLKTARPGPDITGLNLMMVAMLMPMIYLVSPLLGLAGAAAVIGAGLVLIAYQSPAIFMLLLALVAPFNAGHNLGPANFKLSEPIIAVMGGLILWRIAVLDYDIMRRLRLAGPALALLGLLGLLAIFTALPHPNFFNVRYEIWNIIAFSFGVLFFKRAHWPVLTRGYLWALVLAAVAALLLRFVFHLSAFNFMAGAADAREIGIGAEDVANFSGGRFRLAGTFGHKNMLGAFIVLTLPLAGMQLLRRFNPARALLLLPPLVALALTDSMTAWGALALAVVILLLHLRRFDLLLMLLLILFPIAGIALAKFGESIFFRVDQLFNSSSGWTTVSARGEILNITLRLIEQSPLLGIGRNNFLAYGQSQYPHAHNLYLMKMVEMGIPGGLIFDVFLIGLLGLTYRPLVTRIRQLALSGQYYRYIGLWLGCLGFMAMNCFDYSYSHFSLGPLFMFNMGVLLAITLRLEQRAAAVAGPGGHIPPAPAGHAPGS